MATVPVFPNACNGNDIIPPDTFILRPWFRVSQQPCPIGVNDTPTNLDWRRKAEILKYKQIGNSQTQKQRFKRVATNTLCRRTQTFAVQNLNRTPKFTDPNTKNLAFIGANSLTLPNYTPRITYTYGADVPGPAKALTPVPDVPLTRYPQERRVYRGGAEKWPQWGWYPGANGFPVSKKGQS